MSENENEINTNSSETSNEATPSTDTATPNNAAAAPEEAAAASVSTEEITYHAVEKDGQVTAIWEMQGRKHLRTIDPRSHQGQDILRLYTSEHHEDVSAADVSATPPQEEAQSTAGA
ncbi:MAG: hypothetical protein ABR577_10520 [Pyrinomonadaceae bacterium]